jgi:cytochrome c oxidase assembly protein subunit 15
MPAMPAARLARLAWSVLGLNLLVILWGAVVRATGSGAGCGSHWPLCDGEVVPRAPSVEKLIEYAHRASSGLALAAVVALAVAAFGALPKRHPARRAAAWALGIILLEAALGAGLVLFGLVARDASPARAVVMAVHLVNTLFLLAALALAAWFAGGHPAPRFGGRRGATALWSGTLAALAIAGASGAVAALGDTLWPARTLGEALAQDLSPTAHALVRLRIAHPAVAIAAAVLVLALAARWQGPWARAAGALALVQIGLGVANVALLAPVALQIAHLATADLTWIATVLAGAAELAARPAPAPIAL